MICPFSSKCYIILIKLEDEGITNEIVNDFVAYYISTAFDMDALWDENFDISCETAIEMLYQIDTISYNKDSIYKKIVLNLQ